MTVTGQKNHYNAKLLKGYGVSLNLKENRICTKILVIERYGPETIVRGEL